MKKSIEATFTLEEVAEHFKQWRNGKEKGERIPESLWSEAIGLVGTYGVSQVTRSLHLSGTDLNKRRGIVGTSKRRRGAGGKTMFMEVAPALVDQALGDIEKKRFDESESILTPLLKAHPEIHYVNYGIGAFYAFKNENQKAIHHCM